MSEQRGSSGLNWWETPFERRSVQVGMRVWTEDGVRLGRVRHIYGAVLEVSPHALGRAAYHVPVAQIAALTADGVRVRGPASAYVLEPRTRGEPGEVPGHTLPLPDSLLH